MKFHNEKLLTRKHRIYSIIDNWILVYIFGYFFVVLYYSAFGEKSLHDFEGVWWNCLKYWFILIPILLLLIWRSVNKHLEAIEFDKDGITYYEHRCYTEGEKISYSDIDNVLISLRKMGVPGKELRGGIYISLKSSNLNGNGFYRFNLSYKIAYALYQHKDEFHLEFYGEYPNVRVDLKKRFNLNEDEVLSKEEELFLIKKYCRTATIKDGNKLLERFRERACHGKY